MRVIELHRLVFVCFNRSSLEIAMHKGRKIDMISETENYAKKIN